MKNIFGIYDSCRLLRISVCNLAQILYFFKRRIPKSIQNTEIEGSFFGGACCISWKNSLDIQVSSLLFSTCQIGISYYQEGAGISVMPLFLSAGGRKAHASSFTRTNHGTLDLASMKNPDKGGVS
jgi:hypothetical protein